MSRTIALNWIDWVTLAIVLVSILRGSRYGVWGGLADVAALAGAFFAASALYGAAASNVAVFLPMLPLPGAGVVGALLGAFRGLVLVAALLMVTLAAPFRGVISADSSHSQVAPYLLRASARVTAALLPVLPVRVPRIGPGGATF